MTTYTKRTAIVLTSLMVAASAAVAQLENTKIAFVSDRDGYNQIYVIGLDGTGLQQLTANTANDEAPDWSPDGARIVFASDRDGYRDIFVMDVNGLSPQNLTGAGGSAADIDFDPKWSPDGNQIVFRSHDAPVGLWVMDASGANATNIIPGATNPFAGEEAYHPVWSPDGAQIAFMRITDGYSLYVVPASGGDATKLFGSGSSTKGISRPDWSPDGTQIAFEYHPAGADGDIYLVPSDGSAAPSLLSNAFSGGLSLGQSDPTWSPDGTRIAFVEGGDIFIANADGTGTAAALPGSSGGTNTHPDWSPLTLTPTVTVTSPAANDVLTLGTTSVSATVSVGNHAAPGSWAWQLDTPFPASGPAGGNPVAAGTTTATVTGLADGRTYTLYVALIDGAGNLLSPSVMDSVTFSVDGPPTVSITSPTEGQQFAVGTTSVGLTVNAGNHPAPGHWHWQLDTPFAASGLAGGTEVAAGASAATITGLTDGTAYTVYVALVDGSESLLSPSVTASATFTVGSLTDTLTVADKQGGAGTTVTIPVDIYDVAALNVAAVDLIVSYDDTILTPTSDASGTTAAAPGPVVPAGWSVQQNVSAPGSLVVSMASDFGSALTGAGTLVTLGFDVAATATAGVTTPIGLSGVELNEGAVSVTAIGGTFTVLNIVYGDVTGNGSVGAYDAAWMLEHVVNGALSIVIDFPIETAAPVWAPLPLSKAEALEVADVVVPDGLVTASDAADVLRFRVGLIGSLAPAAAPAPGALAAAPTGRLRASSTSSRPGARVTVSLDASSAADLFSGELVLQFDGALLRPVDVKLRRADSGDATGRPILARRESDGRLAIAFASARPLGASGSVLDVTFETSRGISRATESAIRASHLRLNRTRVETDFAYRFRVEPFQTRLMANYPNPFNPETWIPFELAEDARVTVRIYDLGGTVVRALELGERPMGEHADRAHAAYWDGRNQAGEPVASGVYVYELTAGDRREVRRMVVAK